MSHIRIFKHYIPAALLVLTVLELGVLFGSAILGHTLRFHNDPGWTLRLDSELVSRAVLFAAVLHTCTLAMGVYATGYREGTGSMIVRTVVSFCLLGCGALTVIYYTFPILAAGRGVLAFSIISALSMIVPLRWIFFRLIDSRSLQTRTLVLGTGARAKYLQDRFRDSPNGSADLVGFICTNPDEEIQVDAEAITYDRSLIDIAVEHNAGEIVVALDARRISDGSVFPLDQLLDCKINGIGVLESVTFFERELGILELTEIRPGWMVFASGFSCGVVSDYIMRAMDVFIATVILLLSWPLMVLAALAIVLESGMPVIYTQVRVGLNGRHFNMYKFRSMTVDAESGGKAVWASKNDSRVTRVGGVIRNTRIDELPQLYNVLCGDMSIVGPRPERPEFVDVLNSDIQFYTERHRVKPGLMGWAQLNLPYGASMDDAAEKLRYDLYYVKNRSLMLDIIIMVQTVQVILVGAGVR